MHNQNPMWPHVRNSNYRRPTTAIHEPVRHRYGVIKHNYLNGFGSFGDIVNETTLTPGTNYTITYNSGAFFQPSESSVLSGMRARFLQGSIMSVNRPLFSGRYAITFIPNVAQSLSYWLETFKAIWWDMGYKDATYQTIDEGQASSQAGGAIDEAAQITKATAKGAGDILTAAFKGAGAGLKPLMPSFTGIILGVVAVGGLALYIYSSGSSGHIPFRKNPRRRQK